MDITKHNGEAFPYFLVAHSLLSFVHLNMPQYAAPTVCQSVLYHPNLSLTLYLLWSCFCQCVSTTQRSIEIKISFRRYKCTREFFLFVSLRSPMLIHTVLKCAVNLCIEDSSTFLLSQPNNQNTADNHWCKKVVPLSSLVHLVIYTCLILFVTLFHFYVQYFSFETSDQKPECSDSDTAFILIWIRNLMSVLPLVLATEKPTPFTLHFFLVLFSILLAAMTWQFHESVLFLFLLCLNNVKTLLLGLIYEQA